MAQISLIALSISCTLSVAAICAALYVLTSHQKVPSVSALDHRIGQLEMQLADQFESTQRLIRRFSARAARDAKKSGEDFEAGGEIEPKALGDDGAISLQGKAALRAAARSRGFRV